jgi:hypothetical protein
LEGVGGRVITFGDNRTNNHPHPVSPPQGGGNKAGSFIKVFLKQHTLVLTSFIKKLKADRGRLRAIMEVTPTGRTPKPPPPPGR